MNDDVTNGDGAGSNPSPPSEGVHDDEVGVIVAAQWLRFDEGVSFGVSLLFVKKRLLVP